MNIPAPTTLQPKLHLAVLVVLGVTHLINDLIQSLIPAIYPVIKDRYALDFVQIGMITLTFQVAGSLLQPAVGLYTDRNPLPYSTVVGMLFTLAGVVSLALASSYPVILVSVALVGIGSSIFHPEATRMARYASGGRQGLAQGIFQVGGQFGGAMGPLLAAFIIVPLGQASLAWFALAAVLAIALMVWTARQHHAISRHFLAVAASISAAAQSTRAHAPAMVARGLVVLVLLMFSKLAYMESFRSFYTFYLIDKFGVEITTSQLMLFLIFFASAVGVLVGGLVGDRIGRHRIIWISILGPLPLTLILPYADLAWTGILTVLINLIMASAFASILIYAIELVPTRIGLLAGIFYGLNFGLAGLAAAVLGAMADHIGLEAVYRICSFLPVAGLLAWLLPRIAER